MATNKTWTAQQIPSQTGKTILITGANSGIGYQAALELGRHGAHMIMACRSETKGSEAVERIHREAPGCDVELAVLDMASLTSIRQFAVAYAASGKALDILINNAGVMALPNRERTEDGFERQFGTNHLGHFALTGLLWPAIQKAVAPRVVTVASLAHRNGKMDFDDLQSERKYVPWDAYNNSKLANVIFALELDRRAKASGSKVVSVAAHPGVSRTSIFANGPGAGDMKARIMKVLGNLITQDDKMGALPTEYAATSPAVHGGEYIGPNGFGELKGYPTEVKPRPHALDEAAAKRLWEVSEQLTSVTFP